MLAQYYATLGNNAHTTIFIALFSEESGLLGSQHVVNTFDSIGQVNAVINIEMGGRNENGRKAAIINGHYFSDFLGLMNISLASNKNPGFSFTFTPDLLLGKSLF